MSGSGRQYRSGAQKRKIQQDREEAISKLPKINTFFKKTYELAAHQSNEDNSKSVGDTGEGSSFSNKEATSVITEELKVTESSVQNFTSELDLEASVDSDNEQQLAVTSKSTSDGTDSSSFSTDRALFSEKLSDDERRKIIASGPNRPSGPFPKNNDTRRSFTSSYYYTTTKTGQNIERFWLCYSKILDAVYCQPCWLFADNDNEQTLTWCYGNIRDWKGLSKKIKVHEGSTTHLRACTTYAHWQQSNTVKNLLDGSNENIKQIIIRLLDVTRTLAVCSLPFRGHRENITEIGAESGNYLNFIELLSRYDPLLKSHITNTKNRNKYLHHDIQNEMISLMANAVKQEIIAEISRAPFFSIILDTTQDISKKDQLSICIRYVNVNENQNTPVKNLQIKESFLGFIEMQQQTSQNFENVVLDSLKNMNINIEKCRGQGYDGAANMSGKYSGLQARIKNKVPTADYIHCAAHNLNLVLNDSVQNIVEIRNFYGHLETIYLFFSQSLPRWQELNQTIKNNGKLKKTLKKLCPTRWASRNDCLSAIRINYKSVMQSLSTLSLICKKQADRAEANSIQNKMSTYEFILLLVFQCKVLENINLVSKQLQSSTIDIGRACDLISYARDNFIKMRENFNDLEKEACSLAKSWNIELKLTWKRQKKVKKLFDELAADTLIENPLRKFQIQVFNQSLDIIINQLSTRYTSMNEVVEYFSFLTPSRLVELSSEELVKCSEKILNKYESDFSESLLTQLISFKTVLSKEIRNKNSIHDLAKYFMDENQCILSSVPDVYSLFQLFLTLPVTSASAERSFSKLKLIKTYLRSTMSAGRLSDLAIMSIEHERAQQLDLKQCASKFLTLKQRRFGKSN